MSEELVAPGDATAIFMPISPTVTVGLRLGDSRRGTILESLVDDLNTEQTSTAKRWVACRPGSRPDAGYQRHLRQLTTRGRRADGPIARVIDSPNLVAG